MGWTCSTIPKWLSRTVCNCFYSVLLFSLSLFSSSYFCLQLTFILAPEGKLLWLELAKIWDVLKGKKMDKFIESLLGACVEMDHLMTLMSCITGEQMSDSINNNIRTEEGEKERWSTVIMRHCLTTLIHTSSLPKCVQMLDKRFNLGGRLGITFSCSSKLAICVGSWRRASSLPPRI